MRMSLWLLLLPLAACSGLGSVPTDFTAMAREAPQDQPLRITIRDGQIIMVAAPLGPRAVPTELRRIIESVHPGGETVASFREWGPLGSGYRVEKHYSQEPSGQWRSVLVDDSGAVLERTHSLPVSVVPQAVLLAAAQDSRRDLNRVDVVQNSAGEEYFRIRAVDTIGREYLVECAVDGTRVRVARILQTLMTLGGRP